MQSAGGLHRPDRLPGGGLRTPWEVDPTCTTTNAQDNSTAEQNAVCWTPAFPAPPPPPCSSPLTNCQVVGLAPSGDGQGYGIATAFGRMLPYGDFPRNGDASMGTLNQPIVAIAIHPGGGYYLIASDGGIFCFGDAQFAGSTGGALVLNKPMVGMAALAAAGVGALDLTPTGATAVALAAALVCTVSDAGVVGRRLPIHRRQVNERWLDRYRPWVYGAGFGWQIGSGLATYITRAAVYLRIALGALTARPWVGLAVGTGFGFLRGSAVLLTRNLSTAEQLRSFHRRFTAADPPVARVVAGVEACSALVPAVALGTPPAAALAAAALVAVGVVVVLTRGRRALSR